MNYTRIKWGRTASSRLTAGTAKASIFAVFMTTLAVNTKAQVFTLSETVTPATCADVADGSVVLNASGCPGPYVYSWNGSQITGNTVYNVAPGTYTAEARTTAGLSADTLHYEDFQNPALWDMETSGSNSWVINNIYQGGSLFGLVTIPDVPAQPVTFGTPNQNYLHPLALIADMEGISNSNYELISGSGSKIRAVMTQAVSTSGYNEVIVSFWRTGGMGGFDLIYSTDGGSNWSVAKSYSDNPTSWVEDTWRSTQLAGHNQVLVGFSFDETAAGDPAGLPYFSVDELRIIGESFSAPPCVASIQVTVTADNNPPTGGFTYAATGLKTEFTTTATAATGYEWDFGYSDPGFVSTDPNPVYTYPEAGIYQVRQITTNACGADTVILPVAVYPASIANVTANTDGMTIFPNPASGIINISLNQSIQSGEIVLNIFDLAGRQLHTQLYNAPVATITVAVQDLPAGLYSIHLIDPNGNKKQGLFLKE